MSGYSKRTKRTVKETLLLGRALARGDHQQSFLGGTLICGFCGKEMPSYYVNNGADYWGDQGRYNFAGATSNFNRHVLACYKKKIRRQNHV